MFCFFSLLPFLPHSTRGYAANSPSNFSEYIQLVRKGFWVSVGFAIFTVVSTASVDWLRTRIDIHVGYKNVGIFRVLAINSSSNMKILGLSSDEKIRVRRLDPFITAAFFENVKENDVISVGRTKTKRILSIGIVSLSPPATERRS